jgi:hypothetical protein
VEAQQNINQNSQNFKCNFVFLHPFSEIYTDVEYVCTPKSLVIVSVLMVVLINVGMVIGFAMFYRMRKKFWKNGDSSPLHNITPVTIPEVLFRSVYGQLPPNPSFANLGHPLST